jgi:hypothetical protein
MKTTRFSSAQRLRFTCGARDSVSERGEANKSGGPAGPPRETNLYGRNDASAPSSASASWAASNGTDVRSSESLSYAPVIASARSVLPHKTSGGPRTEQERRRLQVSAAELLPKTFRLLATALAVRSSPAVGAKRAEHWSIPRVVARTEVAAAAGAVEAERRGTQCSSPIEQEGAGSYRVEWCTTSLDIHRGVAQADCRMPARADRQTRAVRAAAHPGRRSCERVIGHAPSSLNASACEPRRLGSNAMSVNEVAATRKTSAAIPSSGAQPRASTDACMAGKADARFRTGGSSRLTAEPTRGQSC